MTDEQLIKRGAEVITDDLLASDPADFDIGRLYRVLSDRNAPGLPALSAAPTLDSIKQVGRSARAYLKATT